MNRLKVLISTAFLIAVASAYAQEKGESSSYQFPEYDQQDAHTLDYPSYALPYQETGPHLNGEFLYWQNLEENLIYAIDQPGHTNPADSLALEGHLKQVTYRWDPGVRVSAGWKFSPESMDVSLIYTYFHNEGGDAVRTRQGRVVKGVFPDELGNQISDASSKSDLMYQTLDLEGKHPFQTSHSFLMNFLFGVRGAWISQGWNTNYKTTTVLNPFFGTRLETLVQNTWKFSGAGLRAGVSMDWFMGWGLYAKVQTGMTAIVGRFRAKQQIDSTSLTTYAKVFPSDTRIIPVWEIQLGLGWRKAISNFVFKVYANWEMNLWSRLSQTYFYPTETVFDSKVGGWSRDSVNLQGITAGIGVEF
ncbi:MAG: hypothetical protein KDK64_03875 [Chlamydiia bacterium]|nr:hypothetical protein [Chlamydiia bacterium]